MKLDKIKNLIEKDGGKFIIVEDGEPILVVMSFGDYEKIINGYKNNPFEQADSMVEQKKEIEREKEVKELKQEIEQEEGQGFTGKQEQEESRGLSEEDRNFLDTPIQAEDEEAELEDFTVR